MKKLFVLLAALAGAGVAFAAEYVFLSGATDFSNPSSYQGSPTTLPGESDEILLPAKATIAIDASTASFETFANCRRVKPQEGSVIEITVAEGTVATNNSAINNHVIGAYDYDKGKLVKLGGGELWLNADGVVASDATYYDYYIALTVKAGTLRLPQFCTAGTVYYGRMTVDEGAVLYITASKGSNGSWSQFRQLLGGGELRNEPKVSPTSTRTGNSISVCGTPGEQDSLFTGKICYPISFYNNGGGRITLTNPASDYKETYAACGDGKYPSETSKSVYMAPSFASPGPFGGGKFFFVNGGGALLYLGESEETVARVFEFQKGDEARVNPPVFDAGASGGQEFTGNWILNAGDFVRTVVLTGSNAVANVFNNVFTNITATPGSVFHFTKRGTGAWRFGDGQRDNRSALGGFAIEDGALQFDSITERGYDCSLGRATTLTDADVTAVEDGRFVDYAYLLGSVDGEPAFEYTGSVDAFCSTRPIALVYGGGHLRNSTDVGFDFSGVSARDASSSPTLTLDGSGTSKGNVVRNISDGAAGAKVNVAKEGTGTWRIGGDLTFSGKVRASGGTLVVDNPQGAPKPSPYTWYRLSIARIGSGSSNLQIREICLFDKDGVRQNAGMKFLLAPDSTIGEHEVFVPRTIGPNEAGYGEMAIGKFVYTTVASEFGGCFSDLFKTTTGVDTTCNVTWRSASEKNLAPNPSDRSTWIPIVMHLKDGANPVTHFDIQGMSRNDNSGNWPTRILMEASTDGRSWTTVFNNATEGDAFDYSHTGGSSYGDLDCNVWLSDGAPACSTAAADKDSFHKRILGKGWTPSATAGVPATQFTWYRLTFAKCATGGNKIYLRQICLFDKDGVRQNANLKPLLGGTGAAGDTHEAYVASWIPPGYVAYDPSMAGRWVTTGTQNDQEYGASFSGSFGSNPGVWEMQLKDAEGNKVPLKLEDPSTWVSIVMHLTDGSKPVTHFDIQVAGNHTNLDGWPTRVRLEGSVDGETWTTVYGNLKSEQQSEWDVSAIGGSGWGNTDNGVWLSNGDNAQSAGCQARTIDQGWRTSATDYAYEGPYDQFENVSHVQAENGATLVATSPLPAKGLQVEFTKPAGTIKGFDFAASGNVNVVGGWSSVALPVVFEDCTGVENLVNWTVSENGKLKPTRKLVKKNGSYYIEKTGLSLLIR